jgi:hypothetical protein
MAQGEGLKAKEKRKEGKAFEEHKCFARTRERREGGKNG